jgi:diguanylate cyclase (GGDEF)-like protein
LQAPKIPENEDSRLSALKSLNVLDTEPEDRFDRLTRLAKRMFDVPIALVSLVDENRQWFKSCIGLPVSETPRDISFCGHTILGDDIFLIPDAAADSRFEDNPLVTRDPNIRLYAGCPLKAPDGSKIGTLCTIDTKPRDFGEEDLEALKDLAAMVESELAAVELAIQDDLTGISNRRGFLMQAEHGLQISARQSAPTSLIFFDLDGFKEINDKFGHAEGDHALKAFSKTMESAFRDSDLIARLGGDEFALLQIDTSGEASKASVQRFQKEIDGYNLINKRGYDLAFSYGIVEYNADMHKSVEQLIRDGDTLMYKQKKGINTLNG